MNHFATVITTNHIDKALTALNSLNSCSSQAAILHALVVDYDPSVENLHNNLKVYDLNKVANKSRDLPGRILINKYPPGSDELRWALKPFFVSHLISQGCLDFVCYIDCDLYFYNDYQFIFDELKTHSIILTPHWRQIFAYGVDYIYNYKHGLYNAGFIGFSSKALPALYWWSALCMRECTISETANTYTDQRYLDLFPVYFGDTKVLRHYGCNVAGWNTRFLKREKQEGITLVNGMPVIFIHFTQVTINMIADGEDNHLVEHYRQYESALNKTREKLMTRGLPNCISSKHQLI